MVFSDEEAVGKTVTSNPGTKNFMASEYIENYHFDAKSEVFSIGVSLLCLLTCEYSLITNAIDCKQSELILRADDLGGTWSEDILTDFANMIRSCCCSVPDHRPSVDALFDELASLRVGNGALERLPQDFREHITAYSATSPNKESPLVVDVPKTCVLFGCVCERGVICLKNRFICCRDTCLESVVRENVGSELIPCPGQHCSENFHLRTLCTKINVDVYGELVVAVDRCKKFKYHVDAMSRKMMNDDYLIINAAVMIKQPREWFHKIAPLLKWLVVSLRLLHGSHRIPSLHATDIPWKNVDDIIEQMEFLLYLTDGELEDLKNGIDNCAHVMDLIYFMQLLRMSIPQEVYGAIAVQAYKSENCGWIETTRIIQKESEFAWIKKTTCSLG